MFGYIDSSYAFTGFIAEGILYFAFSIYSLCTHSRFHRLLRIGWDFMHYSANCGSASNCDLPDDSVYSFVLQTGNETVYGGGDMKRNLRLYFMALKNSFASRIMYRADFLFCAVMIFISEMIIPFITLLIYSTGASFPSMST